MLLPVARPNYDEETEWGEEGLSESMSCTQVCNEAVAQNTTLEIFYVLMRSVNFFRFHNKTLAGRHILGNNWETLLWVLTGNADVD